MPCGREAIKKHGTPAIVSAFWKKSFAKKETFSTIPRSPEKAFKNN